ncbi:MAG: MotA/TolQ/ExbB proton channel family protein [Gammaproteobacteria bacterium]|nr:MotA/TolQ/ExbB proton channel family protein [Gammaproteobacteria bacterium]
MKYVTDLFAVVGAFVEQGGPVLYLIGGLLFLMWALIFERVFYFNFGLKQDVKAVVNEWQTRSERHSWNARRIRDALISETSLKIHQNMGLIKTLVALAPMLGLLGTVTGMIAVFHIMAVTGGGDPKLMAGGVSQATIPTMAGMVAALSGVFAQAALTRTVERESALLEDHLTYDHDDE